MSAPYLYDISSLKVNKIYNEMYHGPVFVCANVYVTHFNV